MNNSLSSVNVSGLSNLEVLLVTQNNLTALDLSGLNLMALQCNYNSISVLDVSAMTELVSLACTMNPIAVLDVSNSPNLQTLSCGYTSITELDLTNNPALVQVNLPQTPVAEIDLSNSPNINQVSVGSDFLTYLNLKNGGDEEFFLAPSPNLQFVCTDEDEVAYVNSIVSGNTSVSSYCTFVPGGNYNTILGNVRFDADGNGCSAADYPIQYIKFGLTSGSVSGSTMTSSQGNYSFYTQDGIHALVPQLENPAIFGISPGSASIDFPTVGDLTSSHDYCVTAVGVHPDLEIVIVPLSGAAPGFDASYQLVYRNKGNQLLSGEIAFDFNTAQMEFISSSQIPDVQSSGYLEFDFSNLPPF